MSLVLSSEEDNTEDGCIILSSDEEDSSFKNPHASGHTIFVVDDDSNEMNCTLPDKEVQYAKLPFTCSGTDNSEDPFSLCSDFDVYPGEDKAIVRTTEESLSDTKVIPVRIEEIIENSKNKSFSEISDAKKESRSKKHNSIAMGTAKQTSGVKLNNLADICDPLIKSGDAHSDKQDSNSLKKRLAVCLATLIKNRTMKTPLLNNSTEEPKSGTKENASIDSIIDQVSKSSFSVDEYLGLEFKENEQNICTKTKKKIQQTEEPKVVHSGTKENASIDSIINQVSKSSFSVDGYLGLDFKENEQNICTKTKRKIQQKQNAEDSVGGNKIEAVKINRKRGLKKGWRKHPIQIRKKISLFPTNEQVYQSSNEDEHQITPVLLNEHPINKSYERGKAKEVIRISYNSIQQSDPPSDPKEINLKILNEKQNLQKSSLSALKQLTDRTETYSSIIKPTNKKSPDVSINYTSTSQLVDTLIVNMLKSNENDITNTSKKESTTILKNGSYEKSQNTVEEASFTINDVLNKDSNLLHSFSKKISASELPENNSPNLQGDGSAHFQRDTLEATSFVSLNSSDQSSSTQTSIKSQPDRYAHFYKTIFDDNGEYLCMKMGDIVLLSAKEGRAYRARIDTAQKFTFKQLRTNEINLAERNFNETLLKLKASFAPLYSTLTRKISKSGLLSQSKEDLILLLLTWFLKMYLRVTTLAPEFVDSLHEVKVSVRALINKESPLFKINFEVLLQNATEFESKCCIVARYMQSIFNSSQNTTDGHYHSNKETINIINTGQNVHLKNNNLTSCEPSHTLLKKFLESKTGLKDNVTLNEIGKESHPRPNNSDNSSNGKHQENVRQRFKEFMDAESRIKNSVCGEHQICSNEANGTNSNYINSPINKKPNVSGTYHSFKDDGSILSNANSSRYLGISSNYVKNNRHPTHTVTSNSNSQDANKIKNNFSSPKYMNQYKMGTQVNDFALQKQMSTSSNISVPSYQSLEASKVSLTNKPFETQVRRNRNTHEINSQLKRKSSNSDVYLAKKTIINENDTFKNAYVGMTCVGGHPSSATHYAAMNSIPFSQHPCRSSINRPSPPSYDEHLRNRYYNNSQSYYNYSQSSSIPILRHPPTIVSHQQLPIAGDHHLLQNCKGHSDILENRGQSDSASRLQLPGSMERQQLPGSRDQAVHHLSNFESHINIHEDTGQSTSGSHRKLCGSREHNNFPNYKYNIEVHENNQYSLGLNHSRDYNNLSNTHFEQSNYASDQKIAVTINNFNITNVLPSDSVIKHAASAISQEDSDVISSKDHIPTETIHYF